MAGTDATEGKKPPRPFSLEKISQVLGLITAILLILSIAYDAAFMLALGLSVGEVPTTLSDHVRSAIVWAPPVVALIMPMMLFDMFLTRLTERKIGGDEEGRRKDRKWVSRVAGIGAVLGSIISFLVLDDISTVLFLAFVFAWLPLATWRIGRNDRQLLKFLGPAVTAVLVMSPVVVAGVAEWGYSRGNAMLLADRPNWLLTIKKSESREQLQLAGLRRFSEVAIVVDMQQRVSLLPASDILSAQLITAPRSPHRLCLWFGKGCRPQQAKAPVLPPHMAP